MGDGVKSLSSTDSWEVEQVLPVIENQRLPTNARVRGQANKSGRGQPHSKTLARHREAHRVAARFWSAAVLCRFAALHLADTLENAIKFTGFMPPFFRTLILLTSSATITSGGVRQFSRAAG